MAKFDPRVKVPRANMFGGRKHDLQLRSVLPYGTSCMCVCVCVCVFVRYKFSVHQTW